MQAIEITVSPSDIRYFRCEDGYRYGWYLERDRPHPHNRAAILVVYRVPTGTQAPTGRIPDAELQRLADAGLEEAPPEPVARFPYWQTVYGRDDVPDDTAVEPLVRLPASDRDGQGAYVLPADGYKPVKQAAAEKPAKAAVKEG